ncbi:MAG: putative nucleic acid-binding Zn ribbon protein [Candidatus Aldehydirespiratoraceae bacterium]|jgi:predicted nucleic acid-binding Zn ribbon protein
MPTYVYKFVETGETIEVQQEFVDDTLTEYVHPDSGDVLAVKKVFQPVGVTFKGSGFFKTDNRGSKATTPPGSTSDSNSSSSNGSDSGSSSNGSSKESSSSSSGDSSSSGASSDSSSKSSTPGTTSLKSSPSKSSD